VVAGLGTDGYELALRWLASRGGEGGSAAATGD
jgi:3-dehydroquinate dehydratase